jgi:hypothetical protein
MSSKRRNTFLIYPEVMAQASRNLNTPSSTTHTLSKPRQSSPRIRQTDVGLVPTHDNGLVPSKVEQHQSRNSSQTSGNIQLVDPFTNCTLRRGPAHRLRRYNPGTERGHTRKSNRLTPVNPRPPSETKEASECKPSGGTKRGCSTKTCKRHIFSSDLSGDLLRQWYT